MSDDGQKQPPAPDPSSEGQGKPIIEIDDHHRRLHLEMIARAVREGWELKPEVMKVLPTILMEIAGKQRPQRNKDGKATGATDPKTGQPVLEFTYDPRSRVAASKALMEMARDIAGTNDRGIKIGIAIGGAAPVGLPAIIQQVEEGRRTQVVDDAYLEAKYGDDGNGQPTKGDDQDGQDA